MTAARDVTQLLVEWSKGDRSALERLTPLVYKELRELAGSYFRSEPSGHTLQPTALIHEAYLRLVNQEIIEWNGRAHFFGVAASLMRKILVDSARRRTAQKRGGGRPIALGDAADPRSEPQPDVLALNEALDALAKVDERRSQVVEMHFFGGLTVEEIAGALRTSSRTVARDLRFSKAWLSREMSARS